jgi:MFS family permease
MIIIGLPVLITQTLGMSSQLYGVAQGALASGGLVGGVVAGLFGKRMEIKLTYLLMLACSVATIPMGLTLLFHAPSFVSYIIITIMSFIIMIASTLFNIQILAFAQAQTPVEIVGKVISFLMAVVICARPIGQALYGVLFEQFDTVPWAIVLGTALVACIIAILAKSTFRKLT